MSYINKITVGGKSYDIAPVFTSGGQYIWADNTEIFAYPILRDDISNMYIYFSKNDLGEQVYPMRGLHGVGICYGLGVTKTGGLGLALYDGGQSTTYDKIVPLGVCEGFLGVKATYRLPLVYNNALFWNYNYGLYVPLDESQREITFGDQTLYMGVSDYGLYINVR